MAYNFIHASDIKANVALNFDIEEYLEEGDGEIVDLAQKHGVEPEDIYTPLHYKIKRYGVVYILMRICQDKICTNNVDVPEMEKYMVLYGVYMKEYERLKSEISEEMITGNVNEKRDRAILSGVIYRS